MLVSSTSMFNILRQRQDGRRFVDILKFKCYILIQISLKFILEGPMDNKCVLAQIRAWRRTSDKPLSDIIHDTIVCRVDCFRKIPNVFWWRIFKMAKFGLMLWECFFKEANTLNWCLIRLKAGTLVFLSSLLVTVMSHECHGVSNHINSMNVCPRAHTG